MPDISLDDPGTRTIISKRIGIDIDAWAVANYEEEHRTHLGASLIANDCLNYQFLTFRWAAKEELNGRVRRLFKRGHREEAVMIEYLRGIGCTVQDRDPETGKQFIISGAKGHYGGSIDYKVWLPTSYGIPGPILGECKTKGTGAGFTKLMQNGVAMEQPEHYGQMSAYGYKLGMQYGLYTSTCKNDDVIQIEIVKLDWELGRRLEQRAERVVESQEPLGKIAKTATHKLCKYCKFVPVCHEGALPEKSCRSCVNATAIENKQWHCAHWNAIIPNQDAIKSGCMEWKPIING